MRTVHIAAYNALGLTFTHFSVSDGPIDARHQRNYNQSYDVDLADESLSDREVLEVIIQALTCLHADLG